MQRTIRLFVIAFLMTIIILSLTACGTEKTTQEDSVTVAVSDHIRRDKLTVGCLSSEEYFYFKDELLYAGAELEDMSVISGFDAHAKYPGVGDVWKALSAVKSTGATKFIFSADNFYQYDKMSEQEIDALLHNKDIDLLLVLGTAAGKLLTSRADEISYDYMVFGSADPISSGIIAGPEERFNDRSYALADPSLLGRQIEGAYELFHFKDIGVVYEDNEAAYSYSGIGQLKDSAAKHGFNIHVRHVRESAGKDDDPRYYRELKAAYDDLADEIDALYITTATTDSAMLPRLLADLHKAGVVTIAESTEEQVQAGVLMHISLADPSEDGRAIGHLLEEYAAGTPITGLRQEFQFVPRIYFNRETMAITGKKLPMEMFLAADKIYP